MDQSIRRWYQENRLAGDAAVALGAFLVATVSAIAASGGYPGSLSLLFSAALVAPLVWRRTEPEGVFVVTALLCVVQLALRIGPMLADVVVLIVVHAVSAYATTAWRIGALITGIGGAALAVLVWMRGPGPTTMLVAFAAGGAGVVAAYLLGVRHREREDRRDEQVASLTERNRLLAVERDQRVEMAAVTERTRIARELHDIVAHSLSVIVVQADGGAAASKAKPEVAQQVLATIAETSRDALVEMRRLVGVLRAGGTAESDHPDYAPAPSAGDIPDLVDQVRRAGVPVDLSIAGAKRPVTAAVGLTLYRVVQESLTNVIKHAGPAARAEVTVHYGPGEVMVTVIDDGRGAAAEGDGGGNGLLGMRERVELHGGTLAAQPRAGGGFLVTASIPAPAGERP